MPQANENTGNRDVSAGYRIANGISLLFNPLLIAIPLYLVVAFSTASHTYEGLLWWLIASLGVSIAPVLFIRRGVLKGRFTDHDISTREQRLVPFLFTIGCTVTALVLLLILRVSDQMLATYTGMISAIVLALLITQLVRWKISLHLIGVTGAVLTLGLIISPHLYWLSPFIVFVGWARWRVKAHTPMQAVAGIALAAAVTAAIFRLFGI